MKFSLRGCATALVTPFKNGGVDYDAFINLVFRQVDGGVDILMPLCTTGETPALSLEEKVKLLQLTRDAAPLKPVIVGAGTNSLQGTLNAIRELEPYGPDAFLIVVPYYNKPTQEGMYQYFKAVAESTAVPLVIYNVPGRTGANMLPDTVLRLARDVPSIIGIKEASGNYSQACEIIRRAPEGFSVMSGDDDLTLALLATGASGVVSVASNAAPADVSKMVHSALDGDFAAAREMHMQLWPLFKACFVESNPVPVKAALSVMGCCSAEVRLPLSEASEGTFELMRKVVSDLK